MDDLMVWAPSQVGSFTLRTVFDLVRAHRPRSFVFAKAWHPSLPLKISFFLLRLLRSRLPLDSEMGKFGVTGPSKCFYCTEPRVETLDHIFCEGEVAEAIWNFFEFPVGISNPRVSARGCMASWWFRSGGNVRLRFVYQVVPAIICWHIWKARNKARFEGKLYGSVDISRFVFNDVRALFNLTFPAYASALPVWADFHVPIGSVRYQREISLAKWLGPPS